MSLQLFNASRQPEFFHDMQVETCPLYVQQNFVFYVIKIRAKSLVNK